MYNSNQITIQYPSYLSNVKTSFGRIACGCKRLKEQKCFNFFTARRRFVQNTNHNSEKLFLNIFKILFLRLSCAGQGIIRNSHVNSI